MSESQVRIFGKMPPVAGKVDWHRVSEKIRSDESDVLSSWCRSNLNDLTTGNYDLFQGNLTRNGQRHRVPCPALERRRWRVLNREGFLQAQGDLNMFFQGFLALSKSFASMKLSCSFCSCCYPCCYSLSSTGSHFNQFCRHSSPWNMTRSDAGKATSQDPSLEGWWIIHHTECLYITRIYGEMRPAVVLTKMDRNASCLWGWLSRPMWWSSVRWARHERGVIKDCAQIASGLQCDA